MIKLKLIGASADLTSLIYTSQKKGRKGSHMAPIDDKLYDVLEDVYRKKKRQAKAEQVATKAAEPRVESKIAPRDIQKMLRAGRTPDAIAKLAGVPVAFVERFLRPVLDERLGIIQEFQTLRFSKQRLGESGAPIGESVARNLRTRRVDLDAEELADSWSATRTDGNPWTVALRFRTRGREMRAAWRFDPPTRMIVAMNPLAADLAHVSGGRARAAATTVAKPAAKKAGKKAGKKAAKKAAKKKPATRKTARKPKASKRPARRRAGTTVKRKAAAKAKPKRRTTRPATRRSRATARRSSAKKRTSRARTSRSGSRRR